MQHRLVATAAVLRAAPAVYLSILAWMLLLVLTVDGAGTMIRHDRLLAGGPPLWLATLVFAGGWLVMVAAMMVPASLRAFARAEGARSTARFALGVVVLYGPVPL